MDNFPAMQVHSSTCFSNYCSLCTPCSSINRINNEETNELKNIKKIRKQCIHSKISNIQVKQDTHLHSLELFGKHSSKDGSGRKSGALGSTVCFLSLALVLLLVVWGSNVKVALTPDR